MTEATGSQEERRGGGRTEGTDAVAHDRSTHSLLRRLPAPASSPFVPPLLRSSCNFVPSVPSVLFGTNIISGMKYFLGVLAAVVSLSAATPPPHDYAIRAVLATSVSIEDAFWKPKIEINRTVTIPHILKENDDTGRVANFEKAAGKKSGPYEGRRFNDTDIYKIIEAASYSLALVPDSQLSMRLDHLIELIADSQEKDGYLFPARTIDPEHPAPGAGPERWIYENGSHELYNAGHLYEAAVAHFEATGRRTLLDVAIRNADLVCRTFGPNGRHAVSGHEEIELALVKLYRATGNEQYLRTADWLVAERGKPHPDMPPYPDKAFEMYNDRAYKQDQVPVVDQDRAVGHAVRAMYLYMAVADVAALTGDDAFVKADDRLWTDIVSKRLYLTGGVGARGTTESFGEDYELPNLRAYTETCASVGNDLWNQRMFLLHGDGKYVDLVERVLYNGVLAGVSLAGNTFFYQNPLESNGRAQRTPYFEVACCPANLARMIEQVPGLVFAQTSDTIYANLYVGSRANVTLGGRKVQIVEDTRYPWDGDISIRLEPEGSGAFTVALRIPGWSRGEPVASDLYRYADVMNESPVVTVRSGNSAPERVASDVKNGYVRIRRSWKKGDTIHLSLPMSPRRIVAHAEVKDDTGKIALQRGPLVYALEAVDNDGHALDLVVPRDAVLRSRFRPDLLNGVEVVSGDGSRPFVAIPYYAWNNRGQGEMAVWIRE